MRHFSGLFACSVYYCLKNDTSITSIAWRLALDFLLHPRFYKELQDLLKKGYFVQNSRKQMLSGFLLAFQDKQERLSWSQPTAIYNFDILLIILQFIGEQNERKARELAQNCVSTTSFQGVIDSLSVLLQLEKGNKGVPLEKGTAGMSCVLKYCK